MEGSKVKNVRNLFKLKKENKAIKERAIREHVWIIRRLLQISKGR